MEQFFAEFGGWIFGLATGAIGTIVTLVVTHKTKKQLEARDAEEKAQEQKNKELEKMLQEKKDEQFKNWVLHEMEPIVAELKHMEDLILDKEEAMKDFHNTDEAATREEIDELRKQVKNIIYSYKFRLIRLCNIHINDGWISTNDFDQLSELYGLYKRLGGNGQAQAYFERVQRLPNSPINIEQK